MWLLRNHRKVLIIIISSKMNHRVDGALCRFLTLHSKKTIFSVYIPKET
jgi:hypothetical protein